MTQSGRKPGATSVAPEEKKIGRQISMSQKEWINLDREAEKRGLSRSALIRMAINFYCQNKPT